MAEDVGECGVEMAIYFDLWYLDVGAVGAPDELLCGLSTVLNNLLGIAAQKDLANCFLVVQQLGVREVPG
jgi:hypothetical protein